MYPYLTAVALIALDSLMLAAYNQESRANMRAT